MATETEILKTFGDVVVTEAARKVAQGSQRRIRQGLDIDNADQIPGTESKTTALSEMRIAMKRKLGYGSPEIPRIATGELVESLAPALFSGQNRAVVFATGPKAEAMTVGGSHTWIAEEGTEFDRRGETIHGNIPARPFLGISQQDLDEIDAMLQSKGNDLVKEYDSVELPPISMRVAV